MVPRAILMKSGLVSVNTGRQVNVAHSKTSVNAARPMLYLFKIAHLTIKRPIHKNTAFKNSNIDQRVNTVSGKKFNTARPKVVVNVVKGNSFNAVKEPQLYGNPQMDLQDQGVIDSGCSRHMTGNMSYLTDYEEIDGRYVAFGGNPKGRKITGKCTIKTARTPQQNGVTERRNRTLIEAARTMLADSKYDEDDGAEADMNNLDTTIQEEPKKQKKDGIFISQDKYVVEILKKFGFTEVKTASTPMETQKPLLKDEEILKGHQNRPWYPKDSSFDLVAYTDSDYARASLDRKSTTEDGKKVIATGASLKRDLQLEDEKDEAVHKELGDSLVRAATIASSLEVEQDNGNITNTRSKGTPNESSSLGTTSGDGPRCQETMGDTIAQTRFENISKLSNNSLLAREDLGEDASKQGRRINAIDTDEGITLVNVQDDADNEMFDVNILNDEEVFVAGQNENVVKKVVDVAQGKGIMIEEPVKPMKNKVQIMLDEEVALKLQAEFDEEERLAREKAKKKKKPILL
ncbi:retrovirus-related pol polyprotein from transposon TNT 1-94 [Tanacetum coccineum]